MKNFNFNRAWESYVSSEISLIQKCVFNIFVLTIHIHIIQKTIWLIFMGKRYIFASGVGVGGADLAYDRVLKKLLNSNLSNHIFVLSTTNANSS